MPARNNAFCVAGTGPIPITEGSTPATAIERICAIGFNPYFSTAASLANNIAAAPSLMPLLLPAVTVPLAEKAGFNWANFSSDDKRGCSSLSNVEISFPTCTLMGIISSVNFPAANASAYFC